MGENLPGVITVPGAITGAAAAGVLEGETGPQNIGWSVDRRVHPGAVEIQVGENASPEHQAVIIVFAVVLAGDTTGEAGFLYLDRGIEAQREVVAPDIHGGGEGRTVGTARVVDVGVPVLIY